MPRDDYNRLLSIMRGENEKYEFYLNASMEKKVVGGVSGIDLLTDKNVDGTLELEGCQVAVLKIE